MINRRILRIKVLQSLYSYTKSGKTMGEAEKELLHSIERGNELFFMMLYLLIELRNYWEKQFDLSENKIIPDNNDFNRNRKFIENSVIKLIENNEFFSNQFEEKRISWTNDSPLIKDLFNKLKSSNFLMEYLNKEEQSLDDDKSIIVKFFTKILADSDELYDLLEDKSIYWNVEIDFLISIIVKFVKSIKSLDEVNIYSFDEEKAAEDIDFAKKLLRSSITNFENNNELISEHTKNWELERIAFIDMLILHLGITEVLSFGNIPKKVTFNEYIDIAKVFSNANSPQFINGILDSIVNKLEKEGKIKKTGRGLINN